LPGKMGKIERRRGAGLGAASVEMRRSGVLQWSTISEHRILKLSRRRSPHGGPPKTTIAAALPEEIEMTW
jgi:hypothetical protein